MGGRYGTKRDSKGKGVNYGVLTICVDASMTKW